MGILSNYATLDTLPECLGEGYEERVIIQLLSVK